MHKSRPPRDNSKTCPLHLAPMKGHDVDGCDKERHVRKSGKTVAAFATG